MKSPTLYGNLLFERTNNFISSRVTFELCVNAFYFVETCVIPNQIFVTQFQKFKVGYIAVRKDAEFPWKYVLR